MTTWLTLWLKHTVYETKGANANQWLIASDWLRVGIRARVTLGTPDIREVCFGPKVPLLTIDSVLLLTIVSFS